MTGARFQVSQDAPWPWLEAFAEEAASFFNGRGEDIAALRRCVQASAVTVLFGKSGLGKTSLLRAGLFPHLREEALLPVHVRLHGAPPGVPPMAHLRQRVEEERAKHGLLWRGVADPPAGLPEDDALWWRLHTAPVGLVDSAGRAWQPVLVLDQFEEIFTLGAGDPEGQRQLFGVLGDLIENRIPAAVAQAVAADEELLDRLRLDAQPYRIVIALREDYLPDLEVWADRIPRLGPNRYRLESMTEAQALDAVQITGGKLVDGDTAGRIVRYVAGQHTGAPAAGLRVEPALLSLVCAGLNEERRHAKRATLDAGNLDEEGGRILDSFYDRALAGQDERVAAFVEQTLITPDGIRLSYPLGSALREGALSRKEVDLLVDRRLLRKEALAGGDRIELVHDRVAAVVLRRRQQHAAEAQHREREREQQRLLKQAARDAEIERDRTLAAERAQRQAEEARLRAERDARRLRALRNGLSAALAAALLLIGVTAWALFHVRQAKEEALAQSRHAQQAEREALAESRNSTALRLIAQRQAMEQGIQPGGEVRGWQELLAARRLLQRLGLDADADLLAALRRSPRLLRLIDVGSVEVRSVAFTPDGSRVISGNSDKTLRLWDARSGAPLGQPWQGHQGAVLSVAFSPDGSRVVSGSDDRTLRLWDARTGAPLGQPWQGHQGAVQSVAFSPDGSRVVSGSSDKTLRLWDARTGAPLGQPWQGHSDFVRSVAFSPDGSRVISGSDDRTLRLWDARTGAPLGEPWQGHKNAVQSVAFSSDGSRVVSGSLDRTLRLWDARTGTLLGQPWQGHQSADPSAVLSVAFSPDGSRVVSGSLDRTLRLWDARTGTLLGQPWQGHQSVDPSAVLSVAFSPDGSHVVSGSSDHILRLWDARAGVPLDESWQGHKAAVMSVAFSRPDGSHVVSGSSEGRLRLWDARTGAPLGEPWQGHKDAVSSVAFSSDGSHVVSGSFDKTLRLWDARTGAPLGQPWQGHQGAVLSVAFSPDGSRVVSGSDDWTLRLWDARTGAPLGEPWRGHQGAVQSVAFSPDGSRVVSGSSDKTLRLWNARTGAPLGEPWQGHKDAVLSVAFSPDGSRVVSGSDDRTLRLWDARTGAPLGEPWQGHKNAVQSVAFSSDGSRIVSGSSDNKLRLWDARAGTLLGEPWQGHKAAIWSVAFSPDGSRIVSGSGSRSSSSDSSDNSVRLWVAPQAAATQACSRLTRNMSRRQWHDWVSPRIAYVCQCPGLPVAPDDPRSQPVEQCADAARSEPVLIPAGASSAIAAAASSARSALQRSASSTR